MENTYLLCLNKNQTYQIMYMIESLPEVIDIWQFNALPTTLITHHIKDSTNIVYHNNIQTKY